MTVFRYRCIFYLLVIPLLAFATPARSEDAVSELLPLEESSQNQDVAFSPRHPRPASRIAENVSVITADRIALLNVHTLAEVLQTLPGFQMAYTRTPGSISPFYLQSAPSSHVQVLLDGVPQNELSNNFADIGSIPAQWIERVDVIKGAASANWGPALGGVINVITKSPDRLRRFGGSGFTSYGEHGTSDLQLETSGSLERFGYYLSGGSLYSHGLQPNNGVNNKNIIGKLSYDLPQKGTLALGVNYRTADRGTTASPPEYYDYRENIAVDHFSGSMGFSYPIKDNLSVDLSLRRYEQSHRNRTVDFADQNYQLASKNNHSTQGGIAKVTWGDARTNLVTGVEYEQARFDNSVRWPPGYAPPVPEEQLDPAVLQTKTMYRSAVFLNGAYTVGALTILPGVRYDHVNITSENFSYTLGATYQLTGKTTLRAYGARAYSLPYALMSNAMQKVWTVQSGVESAELPYLWLKGTLFYNIVEDQIIDFSTIPNTVNTTKEKRQGFELEAKTSPVYGFALSSGYTYTDYRDRDAGVRFYNVPASLLKLGLDYSDVNLGLKGSMTGNYVWWRIGDGYDGASKPIVWDLSLTQKIAPGDELSPELFFSARNLFNGAQYLLNTVGNNPGRWVEGGVRFKF